MVSLSHYDNGIRGDRQKKSSNTKKISKSLDKAENEGSFLDYWQLELSWTAHS